MDKRVVWIRLQQAFGPGSPKPVYLARRFPGGAEEFLAGGPSLWFRMGLSERELGVLRAFTDEQAQARLDYALRLGWRVLCWEDPGYPEKLRNIFDPPAVLYLQGTLPPVDTQLTLAVVGARKAQDVSRDKARVLGYQLALGGAGVVSGGAVGVDAAALTGALEVPGGRVISVLPVSLDSGYVQKNARLRRRILEKQGALVTEYFSQQNPDYGTFPVRNRLITGLSDGVVLVQAAAKSGSIMYARLALEQDRDVFVVPGPQDDPAFAGGNALLLEGAKAIRDSEDIFPEYRAALRRRPTLSDPAVGAPARETAPSQALSDPGAQVSPQAAAVWQALLSEPLSVAQLEDRTGMPASRLLGLLTELELEGLAESLPGKRYLRSP